MIKVQNLCKSYKSGRVLSDINLHVQRGEIFGIVGQSGAGKSTLLRCINGLESFESGKVIVNDIDIARLDERAMRQFRRKIGMIFQNFALLNRKTVLDNVMLPMECWHYPQAEKRRKAEELLALVGLADKLGSLPHELSGGQKQRVAIARALTLDPDILLCDEATSALDPAITQSILELLRDVNRQLGITILMVTHDMAVIKTICKRMAIITGNRIATTGRVSDVFLAEPAELRELVGRKEIHALAQCIPDILHCLNLDSRCSPEMLHIICPFRLFDQQCSIRPHCWQYPRRTAPPFPDFLMPSQIIGRIIRRTNDADI